MKNYRDEKADLYGAEQDAKEGAERNEEIQLVHFPYVVSSIDVYKSGQRRQDYGGQNSKWSVV